jgi:predicted TIM-barrel fold metal-dependent hydrolase
MPTRRSILLSTLGMSLSQAPLGHAFAKASQPATAVSFEVPANACDCHTHIHGPVDQFPYFAGRVYTPEAALPEEMAALHAKLGIKRVVIVTPSVYGTDNSATVWGMKARGADARGVAVIADTAPEAELEALHAAGIRGIRINLATGGTNDPAVARPRFERAVAQVKARGWHVQIYTNLDMIAALKDAIAASPVPVVLDHFGGAKGALGLAQPGFADVLDLLKGGKVYVKISAPYRSSTRGPDFPDMLPFARALIEANPDRIVWGTDWPHPNSTTPAGKQVTDITPFFEIDDGLVLNQLALWAPDAAIRKRILVDNPARLYQF